MKARKTERCVQNFRTTTFSISPRNFAPSQCTLLRKRDISSTCKICILITLMTFTFRVLNDTVNEVLHLFWVQIRQTGFHLTSAQNTCQVTWNGWRVGKCSIQRRLSSLIQLHAVFRIAISQICAKVSHKDTSLRSSHVPVKPLQINLVFKLSPCSKCNLFLFG